MSSDETMEWAVRAHIAYHHDDQRHDGLVDVAKVKDAEIARLKAALSEARQMYADGVAAALGDYDKAHAERDALAAALRDAIADVHGEYCSVPYETCERCKAARQALASMETGHE